MSSGSVLFALQSGSTEPARQLGDLTGLLVFEGSICEQAGTLGFLGRQDGQRRICLLGAEPPAGFEGQTRAVELAGRSLWLLTGSVSKRNAAALRAWLPWTAPACLGPRPSIGLGDRLGLATPGHVAAVRAHRLAPVFAQQSARELARTGRTPQQVLDAACWGVFQEGFRDGYGADADHLKTPAEIDRFAASGFTWYTLDPSARVDGAAASDDPATLEAKLAGLDWPSLDASWPRYQEIYLQRDFDCDGLDLRFERIDLLRAAVCYGNALALTAALARHLAGRLGERAFELEISVDETDAPTGALAHLFVARELARLGVEFHALAPRFVGRFEKGVDYIGSLDAFERDLAAHAAVARSQGGYKLSVHSGSDKFAIYPALARLAGGRLHLKTAGTSFLEALRVVARRRPGLFRDLARLARRRYPADRASYHVSAELDRMPDPDDLPDDALAGLLDQFDARQVLHVTFGSILDEYRGPLLQALGECEHDVGEALQAHIGRHLAPLDGSKLPCDHPMSEA